MHIDDVKEYFLECLKLKQPIRTSSMFVGITLSVCFCLVLFLLNLPPITRQLRKLLLEDI
ncbi:hypothetical protein HMPREF2626_02460 [Aerococcus sp. HMSC062A02]|nr:hypothetical protein HMPREF2626_02460 [Aerococcus sp. HMSC062A02]OHO45539.1 hypothetical protein HMPREF2705_04340 [Aerococcus sp. HMSC035B07]